MRPFRTLRRGLPNVLTSRLKFTPVGDVFYKLRNEYGSATVTVDTPAGELSFKVPSNSWYYRYFTEQETYEPGLTNELHAELSKDDVFYDIGARFGFFSRYALLCGVKPENVFSFEADYSRYLLLNHNLSSDGIATNNCRVGENTSENTVRIDDFVSESPIPTVVKIDVEGAEKSVLSGMRDVLNAHRPTVYVEVHPGEGNEKYVEDLLCDAGYNVQYMDHRNESNWLESPETLEEDVEYLLRAK